MRKKLLAYFMIMVMSLLCIFTSCNEATITGSSSEEASQTSSSSQELQIFKSDLKLTQEQVMSQIKAEYLLKNGGYSDDDEVVAIVTLPDDALIDTYLDGEVSSSTVAEYAYSEDGVAQAADIAQKQEALIAELEEKGLILSVEYQYSTIINAVAVTTTYGDFREIGKLAKVQSTILSDTFNLPQSGSTDASAIVNAVDVYDTGIFNSSSVSYTGQGTAVAILDSGFDCSHEVFSTQPAGELWLSQQNVSSVLDKTNAAKMTRGLSLMDVWYSRKIPFVYDYADKDKDVFPYDSEHGTHVAGIIGGSSNTITGVAVDTQLVLMKVFPDLSDGAETDDILAALEDAVLLNVDAINMSLGSSCGFAREEDGNAINDVYDKLNESGISLLTAASNSYSSGYGGSQGNTNLVTNPDSGTVGSPSTYAAAMSVASISGTKSKYLIGNGSQVIFFNESNSITGDQNDFFAELGITEEKGTVTYEYVTIPGSGLKVNYASLGDLTGKIALVRRGDNTFEEKALQAKNAGAAACIIYNNVDGDILMSMGKTDHIPTISISKDAGTILAAQERGTITIDFDYQAGPFMSDFSSWGPSPNLELKPEITAHGGNITSSVPGGGYDELSGTSMATPNLCGIVVLIRQYLKEKFPDYTTKQISVLTNQMLMSTASIILNEEGNPYSPRKQGAGLASLYNVVNTRAYLTVDGIDRTKLELKDDPNRTGVYTMNFNVVNISDSPVQYKLSLVGMTESVSTSDSTHVAEKDQLLSGTYVTEAEGGGSYANGVVTVKANSTLNITVKYSLSDKDKTLIDSLFPYGMYVEGFVKLEAVEESDIDLNIPFLAFYGDWTEAPMFDKTYYEVESEAHDASIDDEDKIKADYYATTPYGSYFYNYIIPLGTYLYDIDETLYDAIPASEEHIAISNELATIDGISSVYAGLLRNAKTMTYTITDKLTGEVVYEYVDYNANKAYSYGGTPIPSYEFLKISSAELGLVNNRQYEFKMFAMLDYGDGGVSTNVRNTFSFDFYLDDEAPVLKSATYEKVYDKTLKKDRYYLTMTIYDNQYVQSILPIMFTSSSSYTFLTDNPIPVYSEKGTDNVVRIEITDYLQDLYADALINSALAFSIDDYALNSNIYLCQLPGTRGDFKFTQDGTMTGSDLSILTIYQDEIVDLTQYLATSDATVDENKDYLKYLVWSSSNEKIAVVNEGQVRGMAAGTATITVKEQMELKQAVLIIRVKARTATVSERIPESNGNSQKTNSISLMSNNDVSSASGAAIESIRFSYFNTLFAYSRAAQTSQIGSTGSRIFITSLPGSSVSFYPGEKIQLFYDMDPWYVADKYAVSYSSTNETVATVDENGIVTALKKGSATIVLSVNGSNLMARLKVTVNSEFIIEDRTLVAYKGLGGTVTIPDDEGILYIGSYAFCLYDTDTSIELTEDDYDANKIPSANTTVTAVIIPDGVEEIQKYAFYNCSGLVSVTMPDSVKIIREYAFYNDKKLTNIDLSNITTVGREAFYGCEKLDGVNLSKTYAIGIRGFANCTSLTSADLTSLRNTGREAFLNCASLSSVVLTENTKLAYGMFAKSGLKSVDIYERTEIPSYAFAQCPDLTTVNIHNNLLSIGAGAFCQNENLIAVNIMGSVDTIGEQAFYDCGSLAEFTLPDSEVSVGNLAFYECSELKKVIFLENTVVTMEGSAFAGTVLSEFSVNGGNGVYSVSSDGGLLLNKAGDTIILAAIGKDYGDYTLGEEYVKVSESAFSGANITSLTVVNKEMEIAPYAFANCTELIKVVFPSEEGVVVGDHAFNGAENLETVTNLAQVKTVGDYAFANSGIRTATVGANAVYGEGVFFRSKIETVAVGENTSFGLGAFQYCLSLKTVTMPENGGVHFGVACFAYDTQLSVIDLSKTDSVIEREAFYGCSSLRTASLDNVEEVGNYAFADCSNLAYLAIPRIIKIGEGAFARYDVDGGAPQISEVTLPDTLQEIGDGAFLGCEGLTEIEIPASVTTYGDYLFAYCLNLTKVTLPANMTRIGYYSFAGCELLTSINTGNVEEFANYAFTSAVSLEKVDLTSAKTIGYGCFASTSLSGNYTANNLISVDDYAFQGTYIASFTANSLSEIGAAAFQNNKNLTEFVFSRDLKSIASLAFNGCSSLENFYYLSGGEKKSDGVLNDYAMLSDGILYTTMLSGYRMLTSVPAAKNISTLEVLEGTYKIDLYAGNENLNVTKIVLPDTMRLIGNYAFYGYKNLKTVEFRSFTAPALEDSYDPDAVLSETDPGYDLLHNQFDLFGLELYYYTFIDLVGKNQPIQMILPSNGDIEGYDSLVYLVYFGSVENAVRSDYEAMDKNLNNFIAYAKEISELKFITLTDEKLINNAVAAYNAVRQDITAYGYTEAEWNEMVKTVTDAKAALAALKLANASQAVKNVQALIDALPSVFEIGLLQQLGEVTSAINALSVEDRAILDLTGYNALVSSYNDYCAALEQEAAFVKEGTDSFSAVSLFVVVATTASLASLGFVAAKKYLFV